MKSIIAKSLKWLGTTLLAYWFIFGVIVPFALPSLLPKYLSSSSSINIALERVRFNPFNFSLNIKDLRIYDTFGATAARIENIDLNVDPFTLMKKDFFIPYIILDDPRLFITINREGKLNLAHIFPPSKDNQQELNKSKNNSLPFNITLGHMAINQGSVAYTDASGIEIFHATLKELDYSLENISTRENRVGSHQFNSVGSLLEALKWEGSISLSPFSLHGKMELKDAFLEPWFNYLAPKIPYTLTDGRAWLNLSYNIFFENSNLHLEFLNPQIELSNVNLTENSKNLVSLVSLAIEAETLNLEAGENFLLDLTSAKLGLNKLKVNTPLGMPFLATLNAISLDGINASLKNSDYNFSLSSLALNSGKFYEESKKPFASFKELILKESLLTKDNLSAKQISLDAPEVHLSLDENYTPDLLSFFTTKNIKSKTQNNKDSNPFTFAISKFDLTNMSADINTPLQNHHVKNLSLHLENISDDFKKEVPYEVFGSVDEALFESKGVIAPNPFFINATFEANHPKIEHYNPYFAPLFLGFLQQGSLNTKGTIKGSSAQDIELKSNLKLEKIIVNSEKNEPILKLGSLDISSINFDSKSLKLDGILINEPYANIHIYKSMETNIGSLFPKNEKDSKKISSKEPPFNFVLEKMELQRGLMDFKDDSLPLPFMISTKELNGNFSSLDTKRNKPSNLRIEGNVGEFGYTRIQGQVLPLNPTHDLKLNLLFKNIDLASLTPYSGKFVGYAIKNGHLDLDLSYTIKEKTLLGANSIILHDLTLGERIESEDAVNLPLNLAIAILKDSQGNIDIDLPVKGDLNDPKFSYGAIIWRAVTNLITGIVTSPFRFLGNLLGVDGEALSSIVFEPGFALLLPPEQAKIPQYMKIISSRPELKLKISSVYDPEIDLLAFQTKKLNALLEDEKSATHEEFLESLYAKEFSKENLEELKKTHTKDKKLSDSIFYQEVFKALVEIQKIETKELEDLALERGELIYKTLVEAGALKKSLSLEPISKVISDKKSWVKSPVEVAR